VFIGAEALAGNVVFVLLVTMSQLPRLEVTVRIRPTGGHVALPSGARGNTPFVALVGTAFLPESQNQSATFRGWRNESVELQWF
jgi:hypothetical protein